MLRTIALAGMLAGVLSLGSLEAQQAGKAVPPPQYEAAARQIIAARHQIPLSQLANGRSSSVDYPLTKRQAFIYTVKNGQATFLVWLDAQGQEIDAKAWAAAEQTARRAEDSRSGVLGIADPPPAFDEIALFIAARRAGMSSEQFSLGRRCAVEFRVIGRRVFDYMVYGPSVSYHVVLDEQGNETDDKLLREADRVAFYAKYGKIDPMLFDFIQGASPNAVVRVVVWPNCGPWDPPRAPDTTHGNEAAWVAYGSAIESYNAERRVRGMEPLARRLTTALGDALRPISATQMFISAVVPVRLVWDMNTWGEVSEIDWHDDLNAVRNNGAVRVSAAQVCALLRLALPISDRMAQVIATRMVERSAPCGRSPKQ